MQQRPAACPADTPKRFLKHLPTSIVTRFQTCIAPKPANPLTFTTASTQMSTRVAMVCVLCPDVSPAKTQDRLGLTGMDDIQLFKPITQGEVIEGQVVKLSY